jgi:hypothetical protein
MRAVAAVLLCSGLCAALPATGAVSDPNWSESKFSINRDTPTDTSAASAD